MYVTRPLSYYRNSANALSEPPPEGPNSGILVIQDEELELISCLGLEKYFEVKELPFPQNLNLELFYRSGISVNRTTHYHHVAFIPVPGQPLSSNRYYVIQHNGKHKGEAYVSSEEEDFDVCCFYNSLSDVPVRPLDIDNVHQQFEIKPTRSNITFRSGFSANSVASDGFSPRFLSRRWKLKASTSYDSNLGEASGVDHALRARHPELNFPLANNKNSQAVVVGKWYCPLMFVKELNSKTLREEIRRPMFYEMTLEQKWEQIFSIENDHKTRNRVFVDAVVQKEEILVAGLQAVHEENDVAEGLLWFRSYNNVGEENSVGLSTAIVERMKWEQERVGWIEGNEREIRVNKVEEFEGIGGWKRLGCYVLVESFVLKRLDGNVVLTYAFRHTHQTRTICE